MSGRINKDSISKLQSYLLGENEDECLCDCGKTVIKDAYKVKTGHTKSCGCSRSNDLRFGMYF